MGVYDATSNSSIRSPGPMGSAARQALTNSDPLPLNPDDRVRYVIENTEPSIERDAVAKRYIMTVLAANRVGILAALTNALDELGGNMLDVSQAVIQDFFTMIMAAEFPEDRDPEVIVDHIRAVCRPYGAEVALKNPEIDEDFFEVAEEPIARQRYVLTAAGQDRPGVMRFIAHRLAQDDIVLMDLQGMRRESDRSFLTSMELAFPPGVDPLKLRNDLDNEFRRDGITIALQHRRVLAALAHPEPVGFNTVSPSSSVSGNPQSATGG